MNTEQSSITSAQSKWLLIALVLASWLLIAGLILPMVTLSKFVVVTSDFSIVSGIVELIENGQYVLCVIIFMFSIMLPLLKMYVLFMILASKKITNQKMAKYLHLMHEYGRWAMLDVMVVAVLIMTVKLGALASVEVKPGLYVFALAVFIIMFVTYKVVKLTDDSLKK